MKVINTYIVRNDNGFILPLYECEAWGVSRFFISNESFSAMNEIQLSHAQTLIYNSQFI